jgi:plastocyanin
MASETTEDIESVAVVAPKKQKKLKPARKQVKPGDVVKTEAPQTGKEYSKLLAIPVRTI